MIKRLAILPIGIVAVSSMALAAAPLEQVEPVNLTRDAIQVIVATTTSTTTTTTTPPTTVPPTTIPAGDWKCSQWFNLALSVGWSAEQLPKLDWVLHKESRCNPESFNPSDPMGGSYGLTQINGFWCESTKYHPNGWLQDQGILNKCEDLFDPAINLRAALAVWQRSGWNPW